jgi:nucleotide-binding universal stress UspA family protein
MAASKSLPTARANANALNGINTILLPTDFSEVAHHAFLYALELATYFDARLLLLHTYHNAPVRRELAPAEFLETLRQEKIDQAMAAFRAYEAEADALTGGEISLQPLLEEGYAIDKILEVVKETQPDLILMGTLGAESLSEKIFGSLTAKVIQRTRVPVLAVPAGTTFEPIEHILYATNFQTEDFSMIDRLLELAEIFQAKVSCLHINTAKQYWDRLDLDFFQDIYQREIESDQLTFFTFSHDDVVEGLNKFIASNRVNLLAMLTHHQAFMDRYYRESITREMTLLTTVPLLAFHG